MGRKKKRTEPASETVKPFRDRVLELRRVPASQIVGAPWNWRTHPEEQREALAESLEQLGFFDPLDTRELPDGRLQLIDGHARRELVDQRIGPGTLIPCVVTDFSEEEAKRANLVKDTVGLFAATDYAALDNLMAEAKVETPRLKEMLSELAATDEKDLDAGFGEMDSDGPCSACVAHLVIDVGELSAFESLLSAAASEGERPVETIVRGLRAIAPEPNKE